MFQGLKKNNFAHLSGVKTSNPRQLPRLGVHLARDVYTPETALENSGCSICLDSMPDM